MAGGKVDGSSAAARAAAEARIDEIARKSGAVAGALKTLREAQSGKEVMSAERLEKAAAVLEAAALGRAPTLSDEREWLNQKKVEESARLEAARARRSLPEMFAKLDLDVPASQERSPAAKQADIDYSEADAEIKRIESQIATLTDAANAICRVGENFTEEVQDLVAQISLDAARILDEDARMLMQKAEALAKPKKQPTEKSKKPSPKEKPESANNKPAAVAVSWSAPRSHTPSTSRH